MAIHAPDFRELRLERLSRAFGAVNALSDVTLTIAKGGFSERIGGRLCVTVVTEC